MEDAHRWFRWAGLTTLVVLATFLAGPRPTSPLLLAQHTVPDPSTVVYVLTGGAGRDDGCGAISAVDTRSGDVVYRSPRLGGRGYISANDDLTTLVSSGGAGASNLTLLDASAPDTRDWTVGTVDTPSGPLRISGRANAIVDDWVYFDAVERRGLGRGVTRLPRSKIVGRDRFGDLPPVDGFYSVRDELVAQIIPDPDATHLHVLTRSYRYPADISDVIDSYAMRWHTVDARTLTSQIAPVQLPELVVNEPPGAGLREAGIHNWTQNGRLAWAVLLDPGDGLSDASGRFALVGRWLAREVIFVNLDRAIGGRTIMTATLPSDFAFAGAMAVSPGPHNRGLVAIHGGDKIAIFEANPMDVVLEEQARLEITPVVSPLRDDRRMMSGPLIWSADGSQIIAAGNEGAAEMLIIDVDECGGRMQLRHTVAACPYAGYNGASGFVTAQNPRRPNVSSPQACPTPFWWTPPMPVGSPYRLGLPWTSSGP